MLNAALPFSARKIVASRNVDVEKSCRMKPPANSKNHRIAKRIRSEIRRLKRELREIFNIGHEYVRPHQAVEGKAIDFWRTSHRG